MAVVYACLLIPVLFRSHIALAGRPLFWRSLGAAAICSLAFFVFTNFAVWDSYVHEVHYAQDIAQATVHVRNPAISAVVRLGAGDGCSGSSAFAGYAGTAYALCLVVTNSGQITLTNHTLSFVGSCIRDESSQHIRSGQQTV